MIEIKGYNKSPANFRYHSDGGSLIDLYVNIPEDVSHLKVFSVTRVHRKVYNNVYFEIHYQQQCKKKNTITFRVCKTRKKDEERIVNDGKKIDVSAFIGKMGNPDIDMEEFLKMYLKDTESLTIMLLDVSSRDKLLRWPAFSQPIVPTNDPRLTQAESAPPKPVDQSVPSITGSSRSCTQNIIGNRHLAFVNDLPHTANNSSVVCLKRPWDYTSQAGPSSNENTISRPQCIRGSGHEQSDVVYKKRFSDFISQGEEYDMQNQSPVLVANIFSQDCKAVSSTSASNKLPSWTDPIERTPVSESNSAKQASDSGSNTGAVNFLQSILPTRRAHAVSSYDGPHHFSVNNEAATASDQTSVDQLQWDPLLTSITSPRICPPSAPVETARPKPESTDQASRARGYIYNYTDEDIESWLNN